MNKFVIVASLLLISSPFSIAAQCGSASERELALLEESRRMNAENASVQDEAARDPSARALLAEPEKYTGGGAALHRKYERCLLAVAYVLTGKKKLAVARGSIGLYHDRKEARGNRFYLGMDIAAPRGSYGGKDPFEKSALRILEAHLGDVIAVAHSCTSLFSEESVAGMAVRFLWEGPGGADSLVVWMDERDLRKYEKSELLLKELIGKSGITDAKGKLVRLIP
ncbi:MAG: hypothetical protein EPN93_02205 [Spirochaetes bacterium]|nr:MAG: hypothetical protein EPN93_02205 [Spirochaetota bacterium]